MPRTVEAFAPAKINLTLHVTGQRDDGYHLLDSLVAFADVGDRIHVRPADEISLAVKGLYSGCIPSVKSNLVWQAAEWFGTPPVEISLHKELPPSSGIGGGSSDAAAVIRALSDVFEVPLPQPADTVTLGADVPVCMSPTAQRMRGIGEQLEPVEGLPGVWAVLVNPGFPIKTDEIFKNLAIKSNDPMPKDLPGFRSVRAFCTWLREQRNDLESTACKIEPRLNEVFAAISHTQPLLTRMSGSGATCFGLYKDFGDATLAAKLIEQANPDWWVREVCLN